MCVYGELDVERFRRAYKSVYLSRGRYRTTRRDLNKSLKLALLVKEFIPSYLGVVEWSGERRVLKI